jgi:(1->4)-alpha-D-glucan 1-alpha-D-glucosylmutase
MGKKKQKLPTSIYRLQIHKGFNLKQATAILPYLKKLGVEAVYCSPCFKAYSQHGYDVVDPTRLNPDIGTEDDFHKFIAALQHLQLQNIIDIVPNHMGIRGGNKWWDEILQYGPYARTHDFFDINWNVEKEGMKNKVYLPILGATYGSCLDQKQIQLQLEDGRLFFQVYDFRLPLAPHSYSCVLTQVALQKILAPLQKLPITPSKRVTVAQIVENKVQRELSKNPKLIQSVAAQVKSINQSNDKLHDLLEKQYYRLCSWKVSGQEINYRRFFNFNDLAALAMEKSHVLQAHHRYIFQLAKEKKIQGIRVDHPDGLYDPASYFAKLYQKTHLPIFLEKILDPHEKLPESWPVEGTVGYEYLNKLSSLFIVKSNEKEFSRAYEDFIEKKVDFGELLYEKKKFFAQKYMRNEIEHLGQLLDRASDLDYRYRDFSRNDLTNAIVEVISSFPVYRTYIDEKSIAPTKRDCSYIEESFQRVRQRDPHFSEEILKFLEAILLLKLPIRKEHKRAFRHFVLQFQQYTSPIMARGLEDICFYVYNRFVSLNEVGGDPRHFGISAAEFHQYNKEKHHKWPGGILATSTHDTKRSEDVRMRLNAISEFPQLWYEKVFEWKASNHIWKRRNYPDPNTEYFIYQLLVGLWPTKPLSNKEFRNFKGRLWTCLLKAIREMREITTWIEPNEKYEANIKHFLFNILDRTKNPKFWNSFELFAKKMMQLGYQNSLSSIVLKLGSPGIVDIYQGNETWKFVWVDPDNRQDVDFKALQKELQHLSSGKQTLKHQKEKQFLYWKGLHYRNKYPELFLEGEYIPLDIEGPKKDHVVAFMRRRGANSVLVLSARFFQNTINWDQTTILIPVNGTFTDIISNAQVRVTKKRMPIAPFFKHNHYAIFANVE